MGAQRALDAKLYYSLTLFTAAGTAGHAGLTEICYMRDLTLDLSTDTFDASTRCNSGFKSIVPTFKNGEIQFSYVGQDVTTDSVLDALTDAWTAASEIAIMCLDRDKDSSGAQGISSNMYVTNISRSETLSEGIVYSITLSPSSYTNYITL